MTRRRNTKGRGRTDRGQHTKEQLVSHNHSDRVHRRFTEHAMQRRQQRGISQSSIDTVIRFGKRQFRKNGHVYSMDRRAHRKAKHLLGDEYRRIVDTLDIYVVISLDTREVVTVAHRLARLKQ